MVQKTPTSELGTDALAWARSFAREHKYQVCGPIGKDGAFKALNREETEGLMVGWFANAIMTAIDVTTKKHEENEDEPADT